MPSEVSFVAHVMGHSIKGGNKEGQHGQLGACPFSHRLLLLLEEKQATYEIDFINLNNKPEWLTKVNPDGTVPVLKDNDTGDYIYDSDVISDYLEEKFAPDKEITKRSLGKMVDCPQPGRNLMQAFFDFITDKADKSAVEKELRHIDEAVGDKQPYVGGQEPNAYDVALAPRLHIARACCKALKEWDFGDDFPQVKAYIHRWTGRSSWRNTASWNDESIVEDVKAKLDKMASEK